MASLRFSTFVIGEMIILLTDIKKSGGEAGLG